MGVGPSRHSIDMSLAALQKEASVDILNLGLASTSVTMMLLGDAAHSVHSSTRGAAHIVISVQLTRCQAGNHRGGKRGKGHG